jgi:PiT family inorganic phosphate transporter
MSDIPAATWILLGFFLALALGFEFVNGFHDTANAVATVIYTNTLKARTAVVWSGICNFIGVHLGGTAVAFSIVHLLPVDLLVSVGSRAGLAMVAAILMAAILWNLGTWYLGLPASSSHTLIGAILGIGLTNSLLQGRPFGSGVNWDKALEVGASLLFSPVLGFVSAALLLMTLRTLVKDEQIYRSPQGDERPPGWIRVILVGTCTGVSVAHGSNDGQKGVGLIMLILIGILPARYALNRDFGPEQIARAAGETAQLESLVETEFPTGDLRERATALLTEIRSILESVSYTSELTPDARWRARSDLLRLDRDLRVLEDRARDFDHPETLRRQLSDYRLGLRKLTDYAPTWVTFAVAFALGLGTMVGWKRIVETIGEKIGRSHLTYAQGMSAEVVAMSTIALADLGGLPVSTTHVLSSGVAGAMAADRTGVRYDTLGRIATAWVLTMPAAMTLSGGLFAVLSRWVA